MENYYAKLLRPNYASEHYEYILQTRNNLLIQVVFW